MDLMTIIAFAMLAVAAGFVVMGTLLLLGPVLGLLTVEKGFNEFISVVGALSLITGALLFSHAMGWLGQPSNEVIYSSGLGALSLGVALLLLRVVGIVVVGVQQAKIGAVLAGGGVVCLLVSLYRARG